LWYVVEPWKIQSDWTHSLTWFCEDFSIRETMILNRYLKMWMEQFGFNDLAVTRRWRYCLANDWLWCWTNKVQREWLHKFALFCQDCCVKSWDTQFVTWLWIFDEHFLLISPRRFLTKTR
jgi:hypothetical protein